MNEPTNIALTGPSGSGKSTVGRLVAHVIGKRFVDMDDELEKRFDCTIVEFFQTRGEAAFRDAESALCTELAVNAGLVIATGGGVLLREENRVVLESACLLINLRSSIETLLDRLAAHDDRPLLQGDAQTKLQEILRDRQVFYDAVPIQVDTDGKSVQEVARHIVAAAKST